MHADPLRAIARATRQKRRVGRGAVCAYEGCGERDYRVLARRGNRWVCAEHLALEEGRSSIERHHPEGRHNSPETVPTRGNDHRMLTDYQRDWPLKTLRNPHGSPLLKAAAAVRSQSDMARLLAKRAEDLERLDDFLYRRMGPQWPKEFEQWKSQRNR